MKKEIILQASFSSVYDPFRTPLSICSVVIETDDELNIAENIKKNEKQINSLIVDLLLNLKLAKLPPDIKIDD